MALSRLFPRLPAGKKTVWISRLSYDGGGELRFALVGVPAHEYDGCGGDTYELVGDDGSNALWLSSPPQSPVVRANANAGQAVVSGEPEGPPGWEKYEIRVLRSANELEALADGPPPA